MPKRKPSTRKNPKKKIIKQIADGIIDNWDEILAEIDNIEEEKESKMNWLFGSNIPKIAKMTNMEKLVPEGMEQHIQFYIENRVRKVKAGKIKKPTKKDLVKMLTENTP